MGIQIKKTVEVVLCCDNKACQKSASVLETNIGSTTFIGCYIAVTSQKLYIEIIDLTQPSPFEIKPHGAKVNSAGLSLFCSKECLTEQINKYTNDFIGTTHTATSIIRKR